MNIVNSIAKRSAALVAAAIITGSGSQALAEDTPYVSIFGGANISAGASDFTNNQTSVDTDLDTEDRDVWRVLGQCLRAAAGDDCGGD
ncbi:MAG: hypothetical protein AAF479_07295, partial [Pseudomonadota bacterium]